MTERKEQTLPVTIESTRFGTVEIDAGAVIEFPSGLIGLGGSRYALLARDASGPFVWLHSIDDPSLALPVTNPWRFYDDYAIEISDAEAERIAISDPAAADVYVTVRAAESIQDFTANLKAPILIHEGRGHQVINDLDVPVRMPLIRGLGEHGQDD
jgi:flagellar assembly factor FliW